MSFKIQLTNKHASFFFKTKKEVDLDFIESLCSIAYTAMDYSNEEDAISNTSYLGPTVATPIDLVHHIQNSNQQTKLGERPVEKITFGEFKLQEKGLTLKILNILPPGAERISAIKSFREITKISILGSKEILCGNYPSPLFEPKMAKIILEDFKSRGIFAKALDLSVSVA